MNYLYLLILLLFSCRQKIVDIKPPDFVSYFYHDNDIIFQFDEPVKFFSIQRKDTNETIQNVENKIPVSNNYTKQSIFTHFNSEIVINVTDSYTNKNTIIIEKPYIPEVIPEIELKEVYLKPSKTKNQYLTLEIKKPGDLEKYKIFYFSNRNIVLKTFEPVSLKKGFRKIIIIQGEPKDTIDKNFTIYDSNKMSQTSGLIGIIDYKNCIVDYLIYYDSSKSKNFYEINNYYTKLKAFINENNLLLNDNNFLYIDKLTTKNIISKYNNRYFVNKM